VTALAVAVVFGGPSAEAEVSRTSSLGVLRALERAGHGAVALELDRELAAKLRAAKPDVVFPVTHGTLGEDGGLQGLLEVLALPYVGSGVLASALAASKPHAKIQLASAGVPVAPSALLEPAPVPELLRRLREIRAAHGAAIVLKPASGGSAIGVEIVRAGTSDEVAVQAAERVFALEPLALVEPFVPGLEVTCGVLERDAGVQALPPTLIRPKAAGHYDFISKYSTGGSEHVCPAPLEPSLSERIQRAALAAHRALGCRDLSRVDFVVDPAGSGQLVALEVNTLPGMTPMSLFPEAAKVAGIEFEALCDGLVRRAANRPRQPAPVPLPMP
jgi:D-alanine-D-alanine ligase